MFFWNARLSAIADFAAFPDLSTPSDGRKTKRLPERLLAHPTTIMDQLQLPFMDLGRGSIDS